MSTTDADQVEAELDEKAIDARDKSLQVNVAELWHDTNPIVSFSEPIAPAP